MAPSGRRREPQTRFSAERDFPEFIQLNVGSALVLRTLPGRLHTATLRALDATGLQPESEVTLPADIQVSKPHCFCIKMTRGSFMDYTRNCLLHCGVSNSQGLVYNFDQNGYHLERWTESISVPLEGIRDMNAAVAAHDKVHRERGEAYRDVGHNCYHYAVSFLNSVQYRARVDHTIQSIERELLTPPCLVSLEYLQRYKDLNRNAEASHYSSDTTVPGAVCYNASRIVGSGHKKDLKMMAASHVKKEALAAIRTGQAIATGRSGGSGGGGGGGAVFAAGSGSDSDTDSDSGSGSSVSTWSSGDPADIESGRYGESSDGDSEKKRPGVLSRCSQNVVPCMLKVVSIMCCPVRTSARACGKLAKCIERCASPGDMEQQELRRPMPI